MAEGTFADFIARDRERLHAEREKIFNQQHELQTKLDEINREFAAIDAYEAAKTGKVPAAARQTRGARARPQSRRGSKRDALMQVIKDNPSGLTRGEILERMGLKGDKAGATSKRADRVDQGEPGDPQGWAVLCCLNGRGADKAVSVMSCHSRETAAKSGDLMYVQGARCSAAPSRRDRDLAE